MRIPAMGPGRWEAFARVARELPGSPARTELLGSVIHPDFLLPLASACTLACGTTVLGVFFPRVGLLLLIAIALGVALDAVGGRSWIRRLTPMSIGRSILSWPQGGNELGDERPAVLVCLESGRPVGLYSQVMLVYTLIGLLIALVGTLVHALTPGIPLPTQRWGAVALAGGPLIAAVLSPLTRRNCWLPSATKVASELCQHLLEAADSSTKKMRVAVALIDQSPLHADGLSALLRCHRSRLRPDSTSVICWTRGSDKLALVRARRLPGQVPAASPIKELIERNELPVLHSITSASIALRDGYPSVGLNGGSSPTEVSDQLCAMIASLELSESA
jgi:hypothetical protein